MVLRMQYVRTQIYLGRQFVQERCAGQGVLQAALSRVSHLRLRLELGRPCYPSRAPRQTASGRFAQLQLT